MSHVGIQTAPVGWRAGVTAIQYMDFRAAFNRIFSIPFLPPPHSMGKGVRDEFEKISCEAVDHLIGIFFPESRLGGVRQPLGRTGTQETL